MKRIGICVLALIFTVGLCVPTFATVNQSSANLNVGLKEGKVHNRINSEKNIIDYEQGNSQSVKAKLEAFNTNGLRLAQEADYTATLANAGLKSVYLQ